MNIPERGGTWKRHVIVLTPVKIYSWENYSRGHLGNTEMKPEQIEVTTNCAMGTI